MEKNQSYILIGIVIAVVVVAAAAAFVITNDDDDNDDKKSVYNDGAITIKTNDPTGEITETFDKAPERIIAGNDSALEMLLYFGLGDKIVGVYYDEDVIWDQEPVASEYQKLKERLDSKYFLEGLMSKAVATDLEPDLIIGYGSSFGISNWAVGTTEYWHSLDCNILTFYTQFSDDYANIEGMQKDYDNIGNIFDIKDQTDKYMADYKAAVDSVNVTDVKAAAFEGRGENFSGYGTKSFIGNVLEACGATLEFPDGGEISKAKLVDATDLDAIVLISFGDTTPEQAHQNLLKDSTLINVPAVVNDKILPIGLSETYGGVRALSVVQDIAKLLNGINGTEKVSTYANGPITITTNDYDGEVQETFEKVPERIIAGNDTALEMLLYFGLGDKIVGVYYDEDVMWDQEPVASEYQKLKERLDSKYFLKGMMSKAVAVELDPDLIIAYGSSFAGYALGKTAFWNEQGCNVMALYSQYSEKYKNIEGMEKDFNNIGQIFDIKDKTDKYMSDFHSAVDSINVSNVKVAVLEPRKDGYANYGSKTFLGNVLEKCGATLEYPDVKSVPKATVIDSTDLQAIILVSFGDTTPEQAHQTMKDDSTLANVPAVANDKIMPIGLSETYGGVRALSVVQDIAELLNGVTA